MTHSGFTASFQDEDLILNSHWKDGMFLLDMVFSGAFSDTREHVRVEGTLSSDLTKIYLDLFYQENKVGNIRMTLLGDTVQYVVNLDITRELTHIVFDFIYTSRLRKGDFHIMPPTVYERMDE